MARVVQCPNPSCGRTSHLGEDPLGRIFRCPRCLMKLPTAKVSAVDSGWTNVLGLLPRRSLSSSSGQISALESIAHPFVQNSLSWDHIPARLIASPSLPWRLRASDSGDFSVKLFESQAGDSWDVRFPPNLALQESGEVYVGPFGQEDRSEWDRADGRRGSPSSRRNTQPCDQALGRALAKNAATSTRAVRRLSRFEILDVLGEGHHATVYRAFDPFLERQVALKLPRPGAVHTARALDRFLGEARALARLRHPGIVPVYEAGRDGERHYIAMALIEGRSLAERISESPLPFQQSAKIVAELAEALAYAHGLGIIHRDVKPANIRLDNLDTVYLMDFGIAYLPDSGEIPTPAGTILGTPAYLAPELAQGGQMEVLPASDQYSLGAVLYETLCGQPPFFGPPSYVLFHAIHHDPPCPRTIDSRIPRSLAAICQKAMAKQPDRRYSSCQALADDLRRWLRGETPLACRRGWARLIR
jgi:eukaryotic-like serine/threonine-protein kinase